MLHGIAEGHSLEVGVDDVAVSLVRQVFVKTHAVGDLRLGMILLHIVLDGLIQCEFLLNLQRNFRGRYSAVAVLPFHNLVIACAESHRQRGERKNIYFLIHFIVCLMNG